MDHFLSLHWICYNTVSPLCFGVFWSRGMWDFSSQTGNQTGTSYLGRWSLNPWTTREVPKSLHSYLQPSSLRSLLDSPSRITRSVLHRKSLPGRSQDGRGVGWGEHFLPHKFIKRAFKCRVNSTKQLLTAGRGHQAPRKATQLFERR